MIKGSAILLAGLLVTWILRRRGAAERHTVWAAAIISAALVPVLTFVLPAWQPGVAQRVATALPSMPSILGPRSNPNGFPATEVVFRADRLEPAVAALTRIWRIVWWQALLSACLFLRSASSVRDGWPRALRRYRIPDWPRWRETSRFNSDAGDRSV